MEEKEVIFSNLSHTKMYRYQVKDDAGTRPSGIGLHLKHDMRDWKNRKGILSEGAVSTTLLLPYFSLYIFCATPQLTERQKQATFLNGLQPAEGAQHHAPA